MSNRLKRILWAQFFLLIVLLIVNVAPAEAQAQDYIVSFQPGTTPFAKAAAVQRAGGLMRFNYETVTGAAIRVAGQGSLQALAQDPAVRSINPDLPMQAVQSAAAPGGKGKPGGGGSSSEVVPLGVQRVGAPTATSNGDGIGVAILDTGIDFNHADLAPSPISYSAFGGSCQDDNEHGTHVAGIVAARAGNNLDVVGVAPNATLYCVKVLDASGSGTDSSVIAGLDWILANAGVVSPRISVVNVSLGRAGTLNDQPTLRQAVQNLYNAGIAVVVAAGNDPALEVSQQVPATYPEVLSVSSTTAANGTNSSKNCSSITIPADTASYFTSDGMYDPNTRIGVTIAAPGSDRENVINGCRLNAVGILSTRLGGGTTRMSGTSMAAPHASGIVARLIQWQAWANVEQIRDYIRANADRWGTAPLDSPTSTYSYDGEREGVLHIPQL